MMITNVPPPVSVLVVSRPMFSNRKGFPGDIVTSWIQQKYHTHARMHAHTHTCTHARTHTHTQSMLSVPSLSCAYEQRPYLLLIHDNELPIVELKDYKMSLFYVYSLSTTMPQQQI